METTWLKKEYLILLTVGLVATIPLNFTGLFTSHDFNFHFKWSYLFAEQFLGGELYPRWLAKDFSGYGSPVFFYYGSVPFYFSSLFYLLLGNIVPLWVPVTAAASLSVIASGFTAFLWLKSFTSAKASLIGAISYMVLPYHYGIDLYTRFSYAECWAFVWLPLILLFSRHIAVGNSIKGIVGVSISLALLLMTHLPTALIFLPVPLIFTFYQSNKSLGWINIIIAYCLGFGIASIYWIPAVTYQDFANFKALQEFVWEDNFLLSDPNQVHGSLQLWYYLNFSTLIAAIVGLILFIRIKGQSTVLDKDVKFYGAILVYSFFMVTPLSIPVWLIFTPLQGIGFPWRFLTIFTLSLTGIVSLYIKSREKSKTKSPNKSLALALILGFILIASNLIFVYHKSSSSKKFVDNNNISLLREKLVGSFEPSEHIPSNALVGDLNFTEKEPFIEVIEGKADFTLKNTRPRIINLSINSHTDNTKIRVSQFYFPGWTLNDITGTPMNPYQLEVDKNGIMNLTFSKGKYEASLTLEGLMTEKISIMISAISTILVVGLIIYTKFFANHSCDSITVCAS